MQRKYQCWKKQQCSVCVTETQGTCFTNFMVYNLTTVLTWFYKSIHSPEASSAKNLFDYAIFWDNNYVIPRIFNYLNITVYLN